MLKSLFVKLMAKCLADGTIVFRFKRRPGGSEVIVFSVVVGGKIVQEADIFIGKEDN